MISDVHNIVGPRRTCTAVGTTVATRPVAEEVGDYTSHSVAIEQTVFAGLAGSMVLSKGSGAAAARVAAGCRTEEGETGVLAMSLAMGTVNLGAVEAEAVFRVLLEMRSSSKPRGRLAMCTKMWPGSTRHAARMAAGLMAGHGY